MSSETIQYLCTGGIILGALIIVALEKLFPYNKGQKILREGFFTDFFWYTLVQSYILSIIIFSGVIVFIDNHAQISRLQLVADWPLWAQLVFFVVTHDLYIYWFHRLQHKSKVLWRTHEAHHSPEEVDWLSGSRSHALEILINQTVEFAPIILLGAAPEMVALKGMVSAVWGMYIHSNINVRSGWLQYFINGPEMHRWHHADEPAEALDRNFGTKLAIWDWLFGTAYLPHGAKAEKYGLVNSIFPKNYFRQFIFAFRKFTK